VGIIAAMSGRLVSPTMVGRDRELERAGDAIAAARTGEPRHLLISGEAGVGKSRLVDELEAMAEGREMQVLRGACANLGEGGLPYGPLVEAFRTLAHELSPETRIAVVGPDGADLARLVPALAPDTLPADAPGATAGSAITGEWAQKRLLEAILGIIQRLSARTPVLVVIEDLHWADPASLDALAYLVRSLRSEPVTLALTVRSDELHRRHPLRPWLAELERTGRVERIDLERLGERATADLVGAILDSAPDHDLVRRLHLRSDGNPFFIEELLAADGATDAGRLPPTLREILLARLGALPDAVRPVLAVAAVAGHAVDHDQLAAVTRLGDDELDGALRRAVEGQVLIAGSGYYFRHALLQEAAYDDLLPGERQRLHRAIAADLASRPVPSGAAAAGHWAELAHHWSAARDDQRALEASARAAVAAADAYAYADARRHAEHALELWPSVPDPEVHAGMDRPTLLDRAARAAWLAGDPRRGVAWFREAVAALPDDADPIERGIRLERLSRALWTDGQSSEAMTVIETAVAVMPADPPTAERARVLSGHGQLLMLLDRPSEAIERCREAVDMARLVGARLAEGHALNSMGLSLVMVGQCEAGNQALEQALDIAREAGDPDDIGRAYVNGCEALFFCGDARGALDIVLRGMAESEQIGLTGTYGYYVRENGIDIAFELGDTATAASLLAGGLAVDQVARQQYRYGLAQSIQFLVAMGGEVAAERLEGLRVRIVGSPVEAQFNGPWRIAAAEHALWNSDPATALEQTFAGLDELSAVVWARYPLRLVRVGARAVADLAELARARRDPAAEASALAALATLSDHLTDILERSPVPTGEGQTAERVAELATIDAERTRADGAPGAAAWLTALDAWRVHARPYLEAYAGWRLGEACLQSGDRAGATAVLRDAAATARALGTRPLLSAIEALAARGRLMIDTDDQQAAATTATDGPAADRSEADRLGLTRREREVLGLVAQGWTNRQIAGSLFISENTAGVHVSNILGKLGAATRTEAASIAARLGLTGG
jgi:DNA-binding CsgD family transcriptional regulator/tetratricopeptide (TPR) repeat protein